MPETFNFPEQKEIIEKKFRDYKLNFSDLWLVKPSGLYGGLKTEIMKSLYSIKLTNFVITKYIIDVNLINGKKYDLRLYVLLSGLKPLRIYFFKEGYVRIATEKYSIDENSIQNIYIHLTNIILNRRNKNYKYPKSFNDTEANEWNIFTYKNHLKKYNIEWDDIREKINDLIIKSIISVQRNLTEIIEQENLNDQSFYQILGYDILITKDFNPLLLEININPDIIIYSYFDEPIKANLFIDTLNLVGISPYSRKTKNPLNRILKFNDKVNDNVNNALCELERPRGDYDLIFPKKENIDKYRKFFINNTKENQIFWDKILLFN